MWTTTPTRVSSPPAVSGRCGCGGSSPWKTGRSWRSRRRANTWPGARTPCERSSMNLVIIGPFPADTDTQIRAFFPADWEASITESNLAGPYLQNADALIPEHIPIGSSFLDKAPKLRMIQTGAGYDN